MTKHLITRALAVSLALSTLAGCSQSALVTATTSDAAALQAAANGQNGKNAGGRGQKGGQGDRGQMGQKVDFYADLDLTDDQKAQLQAIAEKYAPAKPADDAQAPGAKLQALLVADTLDAAGGLELPRRLLALQEGQVLAAVDDPEAPLADDRVDAVLGLDRRALPAKRVRRGDAHRSEPGPSIRGPERRRRPPHLAYPSPKP